MYIIGQGPAGYAAGRVWVEYETYRKTYRPIDELTTHFALGKSYRQQYIGWWMQKGTEHSGRRIDYRTGGGSL